MVEMYDCVTEGYYANKVHWISILLDDSNTLDQKIVTQLFEHTHQLILQKLPKKSQQELLN